MRIPEDDLEQQMERCGISLAHRLRVAASEIAGTLPLMKVSDYLTGWRSDPAGSVDPRLAPHRRASWPATAQRWHALRSGVRHRRLRQGRWHRGSGMVRIWIWCSSTTATPPPRPMAPNPSIPPSSSLAWASASSICSPPRPPPASSMKWTCACARPALPGCWSARWAPSSATRAGGSDTGTPGRWCARGCWSAARS